MESDPSEQVITHSQPLNFQNNGITMVPETSISIQLHVHYKFTVIIQQDS
jgi:hypothetical protein